MKLFRGRSGFPYRLSRLELREDVFEHIYKQLRFSDNNFQKNNQKFINYKVI